ncbi:MAG: hypothetical protein H7Y20_00720 [Bryobacteraceae bacterium]|nr:hypothetical protein [Bryobacteraceae bacterium]
MRKIIITSFNEERYGFAAWFRQVLGTPDLERLHEAFPVTPETYYPTVAGLTSRLEARFGELTEALNTFFLEVVEPIFGPIVTRQLVPTPRTHLAVSDEMLAVEQEMLDTKGPRAFLHQFYFERRRPAMFHRDRDYGLQMGTVNLWVPLTRVFGSNSLWLGGPDERGADALPVELSPGECILFDGANRWHGVVWNCSNVSRVGFDVRFYPMNDQSYRSQLAWDEA